MSVSWSQGYFTDSTYTYGYYRELSPTLLRFCCLTNGITPPEATNGMISYCELGFGQGLSVNIHAASIPSVAYANDFNPAQVDFAQELAQSYSAGQVNLYDKSFEEMLAVPDLPQFDYIGLHGIWSWISKENQGYIVEFVKRHLKVGGAFYISYNCLPGWSAAAPVRQLFRLHDQFMSSSVKTERRVQNALQFVQKLVEARPAYFVANPIVEKRFETMKTQNVNYLAHEYFNADWNLMYFTDVADILSDAKLSFVASANSLDNVANLGLSSEATAFLATIEDNVMREQMRDYFINTQFRKDIFIRGSRPMRSTEQKNILAQERFALTQHPDDIKLEIQAGMGQVQLKKEIYQPVINALAQDNFVPKRMIDLMDLLKNVEITFPQVISVLAILVGTNAVAPCQSIEANRKAKANTDKLNISLCTKAKYNADISFLASPVLGAGYCIGRIDQLFLLAMQLKEEPITFVAQTLQDNGDRLVKDGNTVELGQDTLNHLKDMYELFVQKRLPMLQALEITFC